MYENKIFDPKNDEVCKQFSILCNEELKDLFMLPSIVRVM
jgi:hypothetical protein